MINYTDEGNNDSPTHETLVIVNCVLNACRTDANLHHWQFFGTGRRLENSFHSLNFNGYALQSRCFRPSRWLCCPAAVYCRWTYYKERTFIISCVRNERILYLRSFSWYNNSNFCGSVVRSSFSQEISQFNDRIPCEIYSRNDLGDNVSSFGIVPLESVYISSGNGYFYPCVLLSANFLTSKFMELFASIRFRFTFNNRPWKIQILQITYAWLGW